MPGVDPVPSEHYGNVTASADGSDVVAAEEAMDMELVLDLSTSLFLFTSSPLDTNEEETQRGDGSWSQDGDLQECGQLEKRWVLWHEFMKEHALLDAWLRLAEQAVTSANSTHITYMAAKEELRKFERLRCEAGSRLVQLDSLTQRNRTLTQLFQGVMQARLLGAARECGRRWDDVNAKLESIIRRLTVFVSEWEEFEAEREELGLWLADLDVRLTEVDYLNGSTCEKLRRLQSFQQCVCVNSSRVNALLQRGEALIQNSEAADAQHVESRLLELLRRCSHIYNNIARTHTRLLSMRLVFEDDWILSQATDSGCPSETLLEEEGVFDKSNLDLPVNSNYPGDCSRKVNPAPASLSHPPSHVPPPAPSSPTHDHQGLEWDPSVDIGRSVSCDDADSSYFSASTGVCHRDGLKRQSFLSSLDSQSDISNDVMRHAAHLQPEGCLDRDGVFSPAATREERDPLPGDQWVTSPPDAQDSESVGFDGGRVRAWLGVQRLPSQEMMSSCSKAVQTDGEVEVESGSHVDKPNQPQLQRHRDNTHQPVPARRPSSSPDLQASSDCMNQQCPSDLQAEEESSFCEESQHLVSEQSATSSSRASSSLLYLLLTAALALLACLIWVTLEPPCHCGSSRMHRSFHLALRYINGPPPT